MSLTARKTIRRRIHARIRRKVSGTASKPRLAVHFSNQHVYAQLIDDEAGHTLASASTEIGSSTRSAANSSRAAGVGKEIAERARQAGIEAVVFDRGGFLFHGKVKALADAAREAGLKF